MHLHRRAKIQLAIFAVIAVIALGFMSLQFMKLPAKMFGVGRYTVTVELPEAAGLYGSSNVTYRGVEVGRVESVRLTPTSRRPSRPSYSSPPARWRPRSAPPPPAAAHPVNAADFQQVELARGVAEMGEPMSLAVLPDRSVLHTARNGVLRRTTAAGVTNVIGTLPVYTHDEEGLQGVGVDPGFASNRFIYLYYAPPLSTPGGDAPATGTDFSAWNGVNRLSRFTLNADFTLTRPAR